MGCPDLSTFAHLLYVLKWSTQAEDSSNYRVAKCHGHGGYIPVKNTQKQRVEPFLIRVNFGLSICSVQSCKMSWRSRIYPCQKGGKKAKKGTSNLGKSWFQCFLRAKDFAFIKFAATRYFLIWLWHLKTKSMLILIRGGLLTSCYSIPFQTTPQPPRSSFLLETSIISYWRGTCWCAGDASAYNIL